MKSFASIAKRMNEISPETKGVICQPFLHRFGFGFRTVKSSKMIFMEVFFEFE